MEVYLVQHGEAKSEAEDPERPLTDKGRSEVELTAGQISAAGIKVAEILHSGKLRARQTAEILAGRLSPSPMIKEEKGLAPLADPQEAKNLIEQAEKPLMIVGHLPHLSKLASLLISGSAEKEMVKFRMGGIVCLEKSEGNWLVKWALTPELLQTNH